MKYLFTFCMLFIISKAEAQYWVTNYYINFDNVDMSVPYEFAYLPYQSYIRINTLAYPNNQWQIGHPNKTIFNSAYSYPNVIVTDTILSCIPNDTSVFTLTVPGRIFHSYDGLAFVYKLDIDSMDIAMLEISVDSGLHWTNVITDSTSLFKFSGNKPDFSKSTNAWDTAFLSFFNYDHPSVDTFLFRFTFITDTSTTPRDGWMIDNIGMGYTSEGIKNINQNVFIDLYPNPSNSQIHISHKLSQAVTMNVTLTNTLGQTTYTTERKKLTSSEEIPIDVSSLPDGMYFCIVTVDGQKMTKQVTVVH